jgi:beta-galactosidase
LNKAQRFSIGERPVSMIMKNCVVSLYCAFAMLSGHLLIAADSPRQHLSFDQDWKFHLGDDWPDALQLAKAGVNAGAAQRVFDDSAWRAVTLPHDWAIELPFDPAADGNHGYRPVGPNFPGNSIGWYRRNFTLPATDSGKRIWLQFDGAFRDATVWVNGWFVKHSETGYYPFRAEITDLVKFGGPNVVAVKVDASKFEGWFYEGAGIYRHVWLDETNPVAIAPDGVFVYSSFKDNIPAGPAGIHAELKLSNSGDVPVEARITYSIKGPDGAQVCEMKDSVKIGPRSEKEISTDEDGVSCSLARYSLWSPESPTLYHLVTTVEAAGAVTDQEQTEFGIRTVGFDKDKGFLLNGKHYELQGTCNHQDHAGVGAAMPDALQSYRIRQLKAFGCNAYRTSHNPPTPELLDACDRLGMIVMDENRLLGSDEHNLELLETEIRRDRNHPSVCIWSLCNEEPMQTQPVSEKIGATMQAVVKSLDPTRPITAAENVGDIYTGLPGTLEVRGWNYHVGPAMDAYHKEHPNQPNVGTEQGSNRSTRGIYQNDDQRTYLTARQFDFEKWWPYFAARPWLSGAFAWTGFDYRGEPSPFRWPCINSHFGVLDTCGFPKDDAYYLQSCWTSKPMVHLLPHWNWPGKEGKPIEVDAFSNCAEVELFLNGQSLGRQAMPKLGHLAWQVKYAPGTLIAKAYDNGKVTAQDKVETTGTPSMVTLDPDRAAIKADGEDLSLFTVSVTDAQGRIVPTASDKIHFELTGPGKIIGVGNGDPSCHEPDTFVTQPPVRIIPIAGWRWKAAPLSKKGFVPPEVGPAFADSGWDTNLQDLKPGEPAVIRGHFEVTQQDLANPGMQIRFPSLGDIGSIYLNGQRIESFRSREVQALFPVRILVKPGANVIAVSLAKDSPGGGIELPGVNLEVIGQAATGTWSRSVFNGLAQVIVQSTREPGRIELTASADGLKPGSGTVQTNPAEPRPSLP